MVAPVVPSPHPVTLEAKRTGLVILDQNQYYAENAAEGQKLIPGLTRLLGKARAAGVYIVFTVPIRFKGTPDERVYSGYGRKATEPVIYPDGYDKFIGGELEALLKKQPLDTIIFAGSRANLCVLYTTTRAARNLRYKIVIPVDGIAGPSKYEEEYTLHQFATFPTPVGELFTFSTIDGISFAP